jgi:glycosyltransferase involved in cell wall biosynthesis
MNILFVCGGLQRGGLEHEVEATIRLAVKAGHSARLFTPFKLRDNAMIRTNLGMAVPFDSAQEQWRATGSGKLLMALAKMKLLLKQQRLTPQDEVGLARRFVPSYARSDFWEEQANRAIRGCDLLHLFGKPKPFLVTAARCAQAKGIKTIYEEACQVTPEYAGRADHRQFAGQSELCDIIIGRCDRHIQDIKERYRYRGRTKVIEQWAYGSEHALLRIDRGHREGRESFVFGSLGRLDQGKGLHTILHAFYRVKQTCPNVRLRVAGQGQADGALRQLAGELDLNGDVEFIGYTDGEAKEAFYASLDAFVIASQDEGGPITGVEAMAAGLPIVSTPVGAMPERLTHETEALFFEVDSVESLTAAMKRLVDDASLPTRLGGAARRRYNARNHSSVCAPLKIALWDEMGKRSD